MLQSKLKILSIFVVLTVLVLVFSGFPTLVSQAQTEPTQTEIPTDTPIPSNARPIVVVANYYVNKDVIYPGNNFALILNLENVGQSKAINLVVNFVPGDFLPRDTGGVLAATGLNSGSKVSLTQPLTATDSLWGKPIATLDVNLTYMDLNGTSYTEKFTITLRITQIDYSAIPTGTPTPTATPIPVLRPQMVIQTYTSDINPLQPGSIFTLSLNARNQGNALAKDVTMVLGGATAVNTGGTPDPNGYSGSSGDFTNFSPLGSSNIQYIGNAEPGATVSATISLIVNVSINPGAYPLKISFTYLDEKGQRYIDDQVITLLIYSIPQLEFSFYRQPDPFYAGQPGALPLQIVNLGRKQVVLGNLRVEADNADLMNNTILVGYIDPGGYFTLDSTIIPYQPGSQEIRLVISYTDDFNTLQEIRGTLVIDVMDMPIIEPPIDGGIDGGEIPGPMEPETFWQKVWRFIKGLLGLGSGREEAAPMPVEGEMPPINGGEVMPPIKLP